MTSPRTVDQWRAATPDGRRVPANFLRAAVDPPEPEPAPALSPLLPYYLRSAQYSADRPPVAISRAIDVRQFSTPTSNERNRPSTQTVFENVFYISGGAPRRRTFSSSEDNNCIFTNASNVHRFASQFACTSGEP